MAPRRAMPASCQQSGRRRPLCWPAGPRPWSARNSHRFSEALGTRSPIGRGCRPGVEPNEQPKPDSGVTSVVCRIVSLTPEDRWDSSACVPGRVRSRRRVHHDAGPTMLAPLPALVRVERVRKSHRLLARLSASRFSAPTTASSCAHLVLSFSCVRPPRPRSPPRSRGRSTAARPRRAPSLASRLS
jgi:hypothetical protein